MSGFANPIVGGGGGLVYPSIHSPDFSVVDETGWSINKDGTVDFGALRVAGSLVPLTALLVVASGHDVGELSYVNNGNPAFYLASFNPFSQVMADTIAAVEPGSQPSPVPETWHTPSLTGFGANGSGVTVKYILQPDGMIEIQGEMAATGPYTAGTTIFTLPAAYRPALDTVVPVVAATSLTTNIAAFVGIVAATGAVNFSTNLNTGNVIIMGNRFRTVA